MGPFSKMTTTQQKHIMFDLETFGVKPGCIVPSIGAVLFDQKGVHDEFEVHIDPVDCERYGLVAQASTVMWWLEQSDAARNAIMMGKKLSLIDALNRLDKAFDWKKVSNVWCNGASFDFPILHHLYEVVGRTRGPWEFWNEMDMRTIKNLVPKSAFNKLKVQPTVAHSALADAHAQAETLRALLWGDTPALKIAA
jgi:hypothetical protein